MLGLGKQYYRRIRRRIATKSLVSSLRAKKDQEPKLLFIFTGFHGFWPGMGRGLFRTEPVFRETVLRCDEMIDREFSPLQYFTAETPEDGSLNPISSFYLQVVLQIGLAELWRSKGVEPHGTLGCSLGIITSCYTNNSLSLENIFRVSRLYARSPRLQDRTYNLIFIEEPVDRLRVIFDDCAEVSLSTELGPSHSVLVCAEEDAEMAAAILNEHGVKHWITTTGNGAHTPESSLRSQEPEWAMVSSSPPQYEFYSSYGGCRYPDGVSLDHAFWHWQLAKPCLTGTAIRQALTDGYNTLVNLGSMALNTQIKEIATLLNKDIVVLDSIRNDESEDTTFNCALTDLKALGLAPRSLVEPNSPALSADDNHNPYAFFKSLRKSGSVHFLEQKGYWLILDYDDVAQALKTPEIFSSEVRKDLDPVLIGRNPPDHTTIRQALVPLFSARGLSKMETFVTECAQNLLSLSKGKKEFDVVSEFAIPFAQSVMANVLGMSEHDLQELRKVAGSAIHLSPNTVLEGFFANYAGQAHSKTADHFLQRISQNAGARGLAPADLSSLCKMLWITGTTSSSMLISSAVNVLLHHHAVRHEIESDMSLLPQFVEEVLRFESPEQMVSRITQSETIIGDVTIPADCAVKLSLAAANRDPKHYSNPDLFVLNRNPKDHLAFGAASHYCLGAILARLETRIAIRTLLETFPEARATSSDQNNQYEKLEQFRALTSLLVQIPEHPWNL